MEVSNEVIEFVSEDPPHDDPCAVVHTYVNAWWESTVCPADLDTATMTRENRHICMERHRLARLEYAIPYVSNKNDQPSISTLPVPRILEHITPRPEILQSNCNVRQQNFVLATECVDELTRVCKYSNITALSLRARGEDQKTFGVDQSNRSRDHRVEQNVPITSPDPDAQWAVLQDFAPTDTVVDNPFPILDNFSDPDNVWALLQSDQQSTKSHSGSEYSTPVLPKAMPLTSMVPDPGASFTPRLLKIHDDTIIPADITGSLWAPIPRKRPIPKKKQLLSESGTTIPGRDLPHVAYAPLDADALWASLGGEGVAPEIPITTSAGSVPAFNFQAIDPDAAWSAATEHPSANSSPLSSPLPPPAEYSKAWWVRKSQSSPPPHPGPDVSMCDPDNDDTSDDGCSHSDDSTIITPRRRVTLSSPTLSAQAMADVSFFQSVVDDVIFVDVEPASEDEFL